MTGHLTISVEVKDEELRRAAGQGAEAFIRFLVERISSAAGGNLDAHALTVLNAQQVTLWGYLIFRDEMMEGGFVQLIHNGYGDFFFRNPFARAMQEWGLPELAKIIKKAHRYYGRSRVELTQDCGDEAFMSLFERHPEFDALDDAFVDEEEDFTAAVVRYVEANLPDFVLLTGKPQQPLGD